ncbi:MAG: arylsulfotransferase family protein [Myxococcota bacterium]
MLALLLAVACDAPPTDTKPPDGADDRNEARVQELMALGYLDYSDEIATPGETVVTQFDRERSAPGYNLVVSRQLAKAELFDAEGRVVHAWQPPGVKHFSNVELDRRGRLLVSGAAKDAGTGHLIVLDWNGQVLFEERIGSHHDAEWRPGGTIAALTRQRRRLPGVADGQVIRDNGIALVDPSQGVVWERSLTESLLASPERFRFQRLPRMKKSRRGPIIDLLHANSLEAMRYPEFAERHPLYAEGNWLVSIRHQDTLAVIDGASGEVVWSYGQKILSGQHDAQQLPNGNLLVFDNGLSRESSRVLEIDPVTEAIVWQYPPPGGDPFFTFANGSSQRLPNGNTLVADSDHGVAFEVTPAGETVWHFRNPHRDEEGHRATIVRIKRYPTEWVKKLLGKP